MKTFIIAEAGVNHNGDVAAAKKMIDAAVKCKADAIKFQTFKAGSLVTKSAQKAGYQIRNTGGIDEQLAMLKQLELSYADFEALSCYSKKEGILFLSAPFDLESIDFLNRLEVPIWKIPSGEITNLPYLIKIAQTGKPVILSTGMCELEEIEAAVGLLKKYGTPEIKLLQCNTEYPTPYGDVNLLAMQTLKEKFRCEVGYSDHTVGTEAAIAAVALGAAIIEKHFTLGRDMAGPDHAASLEPHELNTMVQSIRNIEAALGRPEKGVSQSERKNLAVARKSIVAKRAIKAGEIYTEENITVKRPGDGISPMDWFRVLGKCAIRDFAADEKIVIKE